MANCRLGLFEEPSRSSIADDTEAVAFSLLVKLPRCKQEKIGKGRDGRVRLVEAGMTRSCSLG